VRSDAQAKAAAQLSRIGTVIASAMVATVGDFKQFKNGSQFRSWLGLLPRQNSTGGKGCSPSEARSACTLAPRCSTTRQWPLQCGQVLIPRLATRRMKSWATGLAAGMASSWPACAEGLVLWLGPAARSGGCA
jgi:hypothetical protein